MDRRTFLKGLGIKAAGGAAMGLAAACANNAAEQEVVDAVADNQSLPEINWQMATSWPVALDTIFGVPKYWRSGSRP